MRYTSASTRGRPIDSDVGLMHALTKVSMECGELGKCGLGALTLLRISIQEKGL